MSTDRSRFRYPLFVAVISLVGVVMIGGSAFAAQGDTRRVSVDSTGTQATGTSSDPAISDDGRYVAFYSDATDLVTDDTNGFIDIFVHDRDTGVTTRASVDSAGLEATGNSFNPVISGDGRYVAFHSVATNLVADDTNGVQDVFVHDSDTGVTTRVSVDSAGTEATGSSWSPVISGDGRYVAFYSYATDLVAGDTNTSGDVFVHDRDTGVTTRVSVDSAGTEATGNSFNPAISNDGRHVAFFSYTTSLVAGDTNGVSDVFVHDRDTGVTTRVSVDSDGTEATGHSFDPVISGDGRYVAFLSDATDLVAGDTNTSADVFVHDRTTGDTTRVSVHSDGTEAADSSSDPATSDDGRYVAFYSNATNLVDGDTNTSADVFVHDRTTGDTTRVSVDSAGTQATGTSYSPVISREGGHVAFSSHATNLVAGDTNTSSDVFVHQLGNDPVVTTTTTEPATTTTTEPVTTTTEPVTTTTTEPPSTTTTTQPPVDAFVDDANSVFEDDINMIAAAGITTGCNPPVNDEFCADDYVNRGQMAAFLNRVFDLAPSGIDWFTDDNTSIFQTDINSAATAGITRGCNPPLDDQYCPANNLTRGQMAAFLNRAFNLAASDTEWFTADNTGLFQADINSAAAAGIARGCNPPLNDQYCADEYLTRGQMAALLNRAITHDNDLTSPD